MFVGMAAFEKTEMAKVDPNFLRQNVYRLSDFLKTDIVKVATENYPEIPDIET